jgi:arsenate reductase-like glutaredoxin family protein
MTRTRNNHRYNVISMRVSEYERNQLNALMNKNNKSVSELMREAMVYFYNHYEDAKLERKVV